MRIDSVKDLAQCDMVKGRVREIHPGDKSRRGYQGTLMANDGLNSEGVSHSLSSIKENLDKEYLMEAPGSQEYDPDAFDSMAVMNSEMWNIGESDDSGLTRQDLLPNGPGHLTAEEHREVILKAAQNGTLEVVQELHHFCGQDILNVQDEDQYTPLHRASYNGHTSVVEYLLSEGAVLEAQTVDGWRPLHCACRWNKVETAHLLIQEGALINSQTNGGQTPLHLASSNDRARDTLELLLTRPDLDAEIKNGQGEVALQVAERNGRFAHLFVMVEPSVDYRKFLHGAA